MTLNITSIKNYIFYGGVMDSFSNVVKFDDVFNYINDGDDECVLLVLSA